MDNYTIPILQIDEEDEAKIDKLIADRATNSGDIDMNDLDRKVAKALGIEHSEIIGDFVRLPRENVPLDKFFPSADPSQGMQLIEEYEICLIPDGHPDYGNWAAHIAGDDDVYGDTPLIATCRALIACWGSLKESPG